MEAGGLASSSNILIQPEPPPFSSFLCDADPPEIEARLHQLDCQWQRDITRITWVHLEQYSRKLDHFKQRGLIYRFGHWRQNLLTWRGQRIMLKQDLNLHRMRFLDRVREIVGWARIRVDSAVKRFYEDICQNHFLFTVPYFASGTLKYYRKGVPIMMPTHRLWMTHSHAYTTVTLRLSGSEVEEHLYPRPIPILVHPIHDDPIYFDDMHMFPETIILVRKTFTGPNNAKVDEI